MLTHSCELWRKPVAASVAMELETCDPHMLPRRCFTVRAQLALKCSFVGNNGNILLYGESD